MLPKEKLIRLSDFALKYIVMFCLMYTNATNSSIATTISACKAVEACYISATKLDKEYNQHKDKEKS